MQAIRGCQSLVSSGCLGPLARLVVGHEVRLDCCCLLLLFTFVDEWQRVFSLACGRALSFPMECAAKWPPCCAAARLLDGGGWGRWNLVRREGMPQVAVALVVPLACGLVCCRIPLAGGLSGCGYIVSIAHEVVLRLLALLPHVTHICCLLYTSDAADE